jgi:hypothetical protein
MPFDAMISDTDSQNPPAYSPDERPALSLTPYAHEFLLAEIEEARLDWLNALLKIPARFGGKRTKAIKRMNAFQQRYKDLLGRPVSKVDQQQQTFIDINEPL